MPSLVINGLSHRSQRLERSSVMFADPLIAILDEQTDGSGRQIELSDPQPLHSLPVASRRWIDRRRLEQNSGAAIAKWSVEHVAVARDPADVGQTAENVRSLGIVVEHRLVGERGVEEIARLGVDQAFGFARTTACVQHE